MNKNTMLWGMGALAAASAVMLLRPRRDKKMRKAMKNLGKVVNTVSDVMGW